MTVFRFMIIAASTISLCGASTTTTRAVTTAESSRLPKHVRTNLQPSVGYSEYLTGDPIDPAPAPAPEADIDLPDHGPSIRLDTTLRLNPESRSVEWTFGCEFYAFDQNDGLWDWTYEARLFDPSNNQIKYATNWANDKTGYSSNLGHSIIDPAEGTYKCTIDWWVDSYQLPQRQTTKTISYLVPNGETTLENAWSGLIATAYKWRGRLSGGSFVGRQVQEAEGGSDVDTCWWSGSQYPAATGLSGGTPWDVGSNSEYGDDTVGWLSAVVDYYRTNSRAPCQSETDQIMKINRPGTSWASYKTNRLKMGFTTTTVWSYRDGQSASKNY